MGRYKHISDEMLNAAKSVDLVAFLQGRGETLKPIGSNSYKLVYNRGGDEHDSITISANLNKWYDHKNQVGGDSVRFCQYFYGVKYPEAVEMLLGYNIPENESRSFIRHTERKPIEKKPFALPEEANHKRNVFAYLVKSRHIDNDIVSHFIHEKKIYQSVSRFADKITGEPKETYNVCFVGLDKDGKARQANIRSMNTFGKIFRMTIPSSETEFSFNHIGESDTVYVFEASIDMLSFITLHKKDWQAHSYVTLDGISEKALLQALEDYPHLKTVVFCTDNDEGGIDCADRIRDILISKGYTDIYRKYSRNKDWNEDLKEIYGEEFKPFAPHKLKKSLNEVIGELGYHANSTSRSFKELFLMGDYLELANSTLSYSIDILCKGNPNENGDHLLSVLKSRMESFFCAYNEKGSIESKKTALKTLIKGLYEHNEADSYQTIAKKFYLVAEAAAKLEADVRLQPTVEINPVAVPSVMEQLTL